MTAVRPDVVRQPVSPLDDAALPALGRLLDTDPFVNAAVEARVAAIRTLSPNRLGGTMLGARVPGTSIPGGAGGHELSAACYHGGNLVPVGGDRAAWEAFAGWSAERPRICSSIVGRAEAVEVMWLRLASVWGPARSVRRSQPLLVLDQPTTTGDDLGLRPAGPDDFEGYLHAAVAMFTEEIGVSPSVTPGDAAFRARVRELIRRRRAFASTDARGNIVFKAEIGAVSRHTAQLQGVWVRPDLRGRGVGTAGVAAVFAHALALAPTVSLYVNDFNTAALRLYERLGMRQVATLSTVLLG